MAKRIRSTECRLLETGRQQQREVRKRVEAVFWIAIAVPLYAYLGYPLVLILLRAFLRRPVAKRPVTPPVSLLVPAYNEAAVIARKVRNSLALDYPSELLEILVACDGASDGTAEIARRAADGTGIRVLEFPVNRGKIATLNEAAREARGDVLVFSDASAMLCPDALRKLVENFADPEVGAVSGKYTVMKADDVNIGRSEDFYWKYETFLKAQESALSSTLGGHGHLHAIRRKLYPFPPPETINDDYVIPVSVLAKGYRAVYEPRAVIREEAHEMTGFGRRVRIMAGNLQQMREIGGLLAPLRPLPLFFFLSHKVSRLAVPFAMLAAWAANLFLLDSPLYTALFIAQAVFYAMAAAGARWPLKPKQLLLPFYFCMINAAAFFGLYHALTNRRRMAWK